jgi:uncharacterized iron-regulated membrane protein
MDKRLNTSNPKHLLSQNNIRKFWLDVHLTLALTIGFFFVILGVTGSFNVFNHELEELGLPQVRNEAA